MIRLIVDVVEHCRIAVRDGCVRVVPSNYIGIRPAAATVPAAESHEQRRNTMPDKTAFAPPGSAADLEEGGALTPKFDADGLVTCVATDAASGEVLMVAHMNAEALARTIASGEAWYYSRSRRALWKKGRNLRPHPARRRDADRLRSGRGLDQGGAGRRRLPHRPPLVLLSRGTARQGGRGNARIPRRAACSIRRRSIQAKSRSGPRPRGTRFSGVHGVGLAAAALDRGGGLVAGDQVAGKIEAALGQHGRAVGQFPGRRARSRRCTPCPRATSRANGRYREIAGR